MNNLIKTSLLSGLLALTAPAFSNNVNFELGLGAPYGGIGGNANFDVGNNIELFAGLGFISGSDIYDDEFHVASDLGYSAGARYYVTPNVRLMAGYGAVGGILNKQGESSHDLDMEAVKGGFFGAGYISNKNKGFTADLVFIDNSEFSDEVSDIQNNGRYIEDKDDNEVKIAIGYRF